MKQQLLKDSAGTLSFRPVRAGQQIVPTAATVTIKKPDATTDLPGAAVVAQNATIAADGLLTYALTAAQLDELAENYVVDWTFTHAGVSTTHRDLWDVVRTLLYPVLTEADLKQRMGLHRNFFYRKGTEDYSATVRLAFEDVQRELELMGRRPWLVIEASQLVEAHAARVFWYLWDSVAQTAGQDSAPWRRREDWGKEYERQLQDLPVRYDTDASGTVGSKENRATFGTGRVIRA